MLRVGDRVRITAQLIHAATDTHVWAQHYERPLDDVLAVHGDVARAIAQEIQVRLTPDERQRLARSPVTYPDAHEAYMRGRHHWRRFTQDGFDKARDHLLQAIALDPGFAGAHAALADVHVAFGAYGVVRPTDAFAQAEASAQRALELDPNLGDAHRTLGFVRMYQWDWPGAEAAFRSAMAAAPGATEAHGHYALYLSFGTIAEAVASAEHARSLDPLSPMIGNDRALALWTAHRYAEAIDRYRRPSSSSRTSSKPPWARDCSTHFSAMSTLRSPNWSVRSRSLGTWNRSHASDTDWLWTGVARGGALLAELDA